MAIDKSRTSAGMKVVIWFVIAAFVLLGLGTAIASFQGGGANTAQGGQTGTASNLDTIGQKWRPQIDAAESQLQSKPKDYALLKQLGDNHYDWAAEVQKAAPNAGVDKTIWARAADYYGRAWAVQATDPAVGTDMSIARFYSADTAGAIAGIEEVRKKSPKFAPAAFNAGIFYKAVGNNPKAIASFNDYLKLEPNGDQAAAAKNLLAEVQNASATPAPGGTVSATATP